MCLVINKKVRNNHHKENGYCVAFKNVTPDNFSPYRVGKGHEYFIGVNISDRISPKLTTEEIRYNQVEKGFHLFLNYKSAKEIGKKYKDKTIKVYYRQEDVVSYGTWDDPLNENIVVVTQLIVKSLKSC